MCRSHTVFSTVVCYRHEARSFVRVPFKNPKHGPSLFIPWLESKGNRPWFRVNQRRTAVRASNLSDQKSPYETLELERDANEEEIKVAYRAWPNSIILATLEEGETVEARFVKIQAAYELLLDQDKQRQYDIDNRVNPMKASQAWMEWLMKKQKASGLQGDMANVAWAEQQQREVNLGVCRLSRSKIDPEEERRILAKEKKKASVEYFNNTLKRHTLVPKKRDLMRKKAEEGKKKKLLVCS